MRSNPRLPLADHRSPPPLVAAPVSRLRWLPLPGFRRRLLHSSGYVTYILPRLPQPLLDSNGHRSILPATSRLPSCIYAVSLLPSLDMSRLVHPRAEASSSRDGSGSIISTAAGGGSFKNPRDTRGPTRLQRPRNFEKIEITPKGDAHFNYVHLTPNLARKTGSVLGTALRHEYPGIVKEHLGPGRRPRLLLANSWGQYYGEKGENGMTAADRVKEEFWSFFTADDELLEELDENIDNYCQNRVPKILCQARVDAVKKFYGRGMKGKSPSSIELEYEQYKTCQLDWFCDEAWDVMCRWWTSARYKELRKRGQEARFSNEDYAHQREGSLPFPTIQQNLEYRFGPEKAGGLDTYKVQMGGFKASLKGSGKILNQKVQKRIVDYTQAMDKEHGENWQESSDDLDGNVVYRTFGGLKHGRFNMGNGSFKKDEILTVVKQKKARSSGSSYHAMQRQNEELQREVSELKAREEKHEVVMQEQQQTIERQQEFLNQQQRLLKVVCENIGISIPPQILASWGSQQTRTAGSHTDHPANCERENMEYE